MKFLFPDGMIHIIAHQLVNGMYSLDYVRIGTLKQAKLLEGFPGSSAGKESACNAGDPGLIPGLGRSPGEGNGNLLQYS